MIVYICFFPQTRTPWNLRTLFGGWFQQALLKLLQCCAAQFQGAPFRPGVMGRESPGILFTCEALGWYFLGVGQHCYFEHKYQVHELLYSTLLQKKPILLESLGLPGVMGWVARWQQHQVISRVSRGDLFGEVILWLGWVNSNDIYIGCI